MKSVTLVIPCYYNELNIPHTGKALTELKDSTRDLFNLTVIMVDDGSKDNTYAEIVKFQTSQKDWVRAVKLTKNFGSSAAVMAGLANGDSDAFVFMSADLQDPPELIPQMFELYEKGFKIVIANRTDRPESFFQKLFSGIYHNLIRKYGINFAPPGGFDLVMFDREIRDHLVKSDEPNSFLPYLVMWYGYPYANIPFKRRERLHGKSSWSFSKKVKAFIDSFVAFSYVPFRFISLVGMLLAACGLIYSFFIIYSKLSGEIENSGWASLMIVLLVTSAFQLLSLGVIGEYIWRNLEVSRRRPSFVIEKKEGF